MLLHTFGTSMEAAMARSRLGTEGVVAHLFDVEGNWDTMLRIDLPVRLLVAEEDFQHAVAILTEALRGGYAIPDGD